MKRWLYICTTLALLHVPLAQANECLYNAAEEMNDYYRDGSGCEDGVFNAVSSSMLGWGVGLAAGIALFAGLINSDNSHVESSSSSTSSNSN